MSTLIMWHNRFTENENEAVETHIHVIEIPRPKNCGLRDSGTKTPRHRETETNKPRHRDSKAFFQRSKNHDIEIPRPKSHDIEFLWNCDPCAP